jgi:hypothetical protein
VRGGADEDEWSSFETGESDKLFEPRVLAAPCLDSVSRTLEPSLDLVRKEAERVTRPPALEADGSGDVCVCGFEYGGSTLECCCSSCVGCCSCC